MVTYTITNLSGTEWLRATVASRCWAWDEALFWVGDIKDHIL